MLSTRAPASAKGEDPPGAPRSSLARRTAGLVLILALVGLPAGVLRSLCWGHSCDRRPPVASEVPFCSLPEQLRAAVTSGFRSGRSPEILAIAARPVVGSSRAGTGQIPGSHWPTTASEPAMVPIVFSGTGVAPGDTPMRLSGVTLDTVAPTIARIIGLRRPHPEVRSGQAPQGIATGERPRLVLEIVWKGTGTTALGDSSFLRKLARSGAATFEARTGSLPLDPAAVLTTIGTGGLPYQHGITGMFVRNDEGRLVRAWGAGSPVSVIAGLADDLDRHHDQQARIGLVATAPTDRGVIGGNWYPNHDRDDVTILAQTQGPDANLAEAVDAARRTLALGYGRDDIPDLLAVVAEAPEIGSEPEMDEAMRTLVGVARRAARGSVVVMVTATGAGGDSRRRDAQSIDAAAIVRQVEEHVGAQRPLIEAAVPGGIFLDQRTLLKEKIAEDDILGAVGNVRGAGGANVVAQVFPALSVSFARYC